jgi:CRISPR-associated endonuclease Csn1
MTSKKILGLDLGTNSIGWALIDQDQENSKGEILGLGSRIIPMSQDIIGKFAEGSKISQTAERTGFRSIRRLRERALLRRERLHRILNLMGFLPKHFAVQIDFEKRFGKFKEGLEPKLAYDNKQFIFKDSFLEMMEDFKIAQPGLFNGDLNKDLLVPYDWTIFYLRKKALREKIAKEELAWILLNFNQKRGYYQLRGEEEEDNPNKLVEFHSLKVVKITPDENQNNKGDQWYSMELENGWVYRRQSKIALDDWLNKTKDFIVTTEYNDDGSIKTNKEGKESRSFRAPGDSDWTLVKKKTEAEIEKSDKTVGEFIYDSVLSSPKIKVKGSLVRTIERNFYKKELVKILEVQTQFHSELNDLDLLNLCAKELYKNNISHQELLSQKTFNHLFINDIIFYQRPLRSQKHGIGNCSFEYRKYKDKEGNEKKEYLKVVSKSHPLFQEFRLWQWIHNLSVYIRDTDEDCTHKFLSNVEAVEKLFDFLNSRKEVTQEALLKFLLSNSGLKGKALNEEVKKFRWNYVEDKIFPMNETRSMILSRLSRVENLPIDFFSAEVEEKIWHLIYSVTDKLDYEKALLTFAEKNSLDKESFLANFIKFPPFKSEYAAFSLKAIKKLLPLMRLGGKWKWGNIPTKVQERISKIINGEFDENIKDRVREKAIQLTTESDFTGLQLWLASYIVYGRHSEASIAGKWNSALELEEFIKEFKQHSLRNPIVEQVIIETLRVVKDIWHSPKYGNGVENYFNEIHIELGREMKNTADERKRLTNIVSENENTNLRIKALLVELKNGGEVENVRPYSPSQIEILKIYEDGVLNSSIEIPDDILKISSTAQPSRTELEKYKLWLEQKYRSPYTGKIIPLNKLFTSEYEIEHIIPQSRYFDDSFSNKVICESAVNKLKTNQIGLEFIKNHHGEKVQTGYGQVVEIFEVEAYEDFVKSNFSKNQGRAKRNKLLLEEIPEKMVERQLNDTRYISKYISSILSNLVRESSNDDGVNSKNIIPGNGKITNTLKQDWGLNDVWNELILPRFERMNQITGTNAFTSYNQNHQKYLPTVPLEYSKGFQKKRIDHRHHAMDALVIACAGRNHLNYLNNQSALEKGKSVSEKQKSREDLRRVLCEKMKSDSAGNYQWVFKKPWNTFTQDTHKKLEEVVVSFKQNLRVINKTNNKYESYKEQNGEIRIGENGLPKKGIICQTLGESWAIRKPMHQETVAGLVKLRKEKTVTLSAALENWQELTDRSLRKKIKQLRKEGLDNKRIIKFFKDNENSWNGNDLARVRIYYWEVDENGQGINCASRVNLDTSFDWNKINTITDTGIQKILRNHLNKYVGRKDEKGQDIKPEQLAFSPEGIEDLNRNIIELNEGKLHQPIKKVRIYETLGNRFQVGKSGNKPDKFVIAAKGTNLFFAVYWDEKKQKRSFETIPLNEVIDYQKWLASLPKDEQVNYPSIPVNPEKGKYLFHLSPNDLVYVPTENIKLDPNQVYKVVSFTGNRLYCLPNYVSTSIKDKLEFTLLNKMEFSLDNISFKEKCMKLNVDRVGDFKN